MGRTTATVASVLGVVLAGSLAIPGPAAAAPVFLSTVDAFGGAATTQFGIATAMAGDGTVVVGHTYPATDGAVEVQVRRPGESFGAVTTLQAVESAITPGPVTVYGGPDGTVAAVWESGAGFERLSMLPPGATQWTPVRPLAGPSWGSSATAIDPGGRVWVGEQTGSGPFSNKVEIFGPTGAAESVTLPVPPNGTFEENMSLAITGDGVGRAVLRRAVPGTGSNGASCTNQSSALAADVVRGTPTATPTVLKTYTSGGTIVGGVCTPASGSGIVPPAVAVGADGATTVTVQVSGAVAPFNSTIDAFHRPAGAGWPAAPETVVGTPGLYSTGSLVPVGSRMALVVQVSTGPEPDQAVVVRDTNGTWSGIQYLTGTGNGGSVAAAGSLEGGAVFGWHELDNPARMQFRTIDASGVLSPDTYNIASDGNGRMVGAGADRQGNAVLAFTAFGSGTYVGKLLPFDGAGPRLTPRSVPTTAGVGQSVPFSLTPVDVWSPPSTAPVWSFGDGTTATGTSVSHTFSTVGAHTVTISAVDALGNTSSASSVVTVRDTVAPRFTKKPKVTPKPADHGKRPKLRFSVDEEGTVTIELTRKGGPKSARKTLHKTVSKAGKQSVKLPKLLAGRWKAVVVVRDAAGNETTAKVRFQVV